jgi:hypothetical protein
MELAEERAIDEARAQPSHCVGRKVALLGPTAWWHYFETLNCNSAQALKSKQAPCIMGL